MAGSRPLEKWLENPLQEFGGLRWRPFLRITAAIVLTYLPFAAWMSIPLAADQKACLSTAIEMESAGSTLVPLLFGEPCYQRPPLQYWATIAGIRQWGFSLFGALLPSVLSAWLAAIALGSIAARLWPERDRTQELSGIWFLASLGTATFGMVAQVEIHAVALLLLAWWLALEHLEKNQAARRRNPWMLYAAWLAAGMGALVQGPLLPLLWGAGLCIHLVLNRETRELRNPHLGLAALVAMLFASLWYIALLELDGRAFLVQFPWRGLPGPGASLGHLWQALLVACLPWAPFAILGAGRLVRRPSRRLVGFIVGSTFPAALYYSICAVIPGGPAVASQALYPLLPAAALLTAWVEGERNGELRKARSRTSAVSAWILALIACYAAWVGIRARVFPVWLSLLVVALAALWIWSIFRPRQWAMAALALVACYHLAAISLGERDIRGLRRFAEGNPHRGLSMLDEGRSSTHEVGLLSLALGRPIERLHTVDEVLDALEDGQAVVLSQAQSELLGTEIREGLGEDGAEPVLEVIRWRRISTKAQLPWSEVLTGRRRLEFERDFQIITLPPDLEREVPEGGV